MISRSHPLTSFIVINVRKMLSGEPIWALLVFVASLTLYLPTLSPSVVLDDGGEFQMLAYTLGIAHPTGYPLFTLLGWLFSHLPLGGDVAFRVTLLCALSAAGAMAFLYLTVRELGVGHFASAAAALLLAVAQRIWMHASAAEVYSLANLFILLGTWLLFRWGGGRSPLWVVTLAFGIGLTHHIQLRLFGPAALIYVFSVEPRLFLRPRRWLPAVIALILPLLLYLYIPLRANQLLAAPEWTGLVLGVRKSVASGLITPHYFAGGPAALILAMDYSQRFFGGAGWGLETFRQFVSMVGEQFPWSVMPIMLLGAGTLIRRRRKESLYLWISAVLLLWTALKFLAQIAEDGDNFIPTYLLMGIWFGAGADTLLSWADGRLDRRLPRSLLLAAILAFPCYSAISHFPQAMHRRQLDMAANAQNALSAPLPEGAVLAGAWPYVTPLRYMQRVEAMRADLWVIAADTVGINKLARRAIASNAPFYAIRPTIAGLRLQPLPVQDHSTISREMEYSLSNGVRWRGYDIEPFRPQAGDVVRMTLYWQAEAALDEDWITFVHLLDESGDKVAQADELTVGPYYPSSEWQPGILLADQHELALPPDLPAGRYRLVFGWYTQEAGRLDWADGTDVRTLVEFTL